MQNAGKLIFIAGLVLALVGLMIWKTGGLGPIGRMPGDIFIRKGQSTFYFPVVTCIVISLLLTLLSWLFRR